MKKFVGKRGTGKTTELIEYAVKNNIKYTVCDSNTIIKKFGLVHSLGYDGLVKFFPYEDAELLEDDFLVDDLELFAIRAFQNKVKGFTLSVD